MQRQTEWAFDRGGRRREVQKSPGRAALAALGKQFARFRAEHREGTRIPVELRVAVVAALEQGAKLGEVQRVCKVSWSQVRSWQERDLHAQAPGDGGPGESVRVFAVEDEAGAGNGAPAALGEGEALELRLGPWSVSVRLAGGGGGGRACSR
jgi:hypothetical protein